MDINVLNKLKHNLSKDFVLQFDKYQLSDDGFVPIMLKEKTAFIAIGASSNKELIVQLLKDKGLNTKFFPIQDDEIEALIGYVTREFFKETQEEQPVQEMNFEQQSQIKQEPQDFSQTVNQTSEEAPQEESNFEKPHPQHTYENNGEMVSLTNLRNIEMTDKKKIGEILIEKGYINKTQLTEALADCKKNKVPLGSMLCMLGYIKLEQLKEALGEQQHIKILDGDSFEINEDVVNIFPADFIRNNKVVPVSSDGRNVVVGMINPTNERVLKDIVYLTGLKPRAMLITHIEFQNFLEAYFSDSKIETGALMQQLEEVSEDAEEETIWDQAERDIQDDSGTVAQFVNKIITNAIDTGASDIHIEPRLRNYVVRYRKDGILKKELDIPPKVDNSIITRFKVLSRMDISEHRRSQDGMFSMKYKGLTYDFRINTLPVAGKEKVVIRILAPAVSLEASDKEIKLKGAFEEDNEKVKKMVTAPNGIILTSGPTGSGKTTTLYTILKSLNQESVNITTIEDPVEIKLEGINQSQINTKAGITFASVMRAILRQDPDIILIGEIRDYETLETAISAALTGHLVLSTIHTNSAATTVTRLIEMGAKDYLVSSTLTGVVAQRLVRHLCPACREEYYASLEEAKQLFIDPVEAEKFTKTKIYKAKGCKKCEFTGYDGRFGIYEILSVNKEIKKLIAGGVPDIEIEEAAIACGMKSLNQSCLDNIIRGETTIEEYVRVLGVANE
ncbi:Flp pilus assembly complex ATPase component TadA [bacterium]|nr:Flp pilus assembly complex ATPase component TadA [bacterium]